MQTPRLSPRVSPAVGNAAPASTATPRAPVRAEAWPPLRLRRALPKDAQAVWALCREAAGLAAGAPLPLPLRETLFDIPCRGWAWLAEVDGQCVGMAAASAGLALPQGAYRLSVDGLYVRPAWRGRGMGGRLLEHVRDMAAEMGCAELRLPDGRLLPISFSTPVSARA